jgi:hypothetical protein
MVKSVLNKYEHATGQLLSPQKFSMLLENKCIEKQGQLEASIGLIKCRFQGEVHGSSRMHVRWQISAGQEENQKAWLREKKI